MSIKVPTDYSKVADIPKDLKLMAESIQEELDLKQSQIDALTAENQSYKRQIPKGQASGDSITINDSSDLSIESIMLKGKTHQETREGYNICPTDVSNWEIGYYSTVNGTKTTETSNNHTQMVRVKDLIKVSPNTSIYFNTFDTSYLFYVRAYDINKNFIENLGVAKNGDYITTGETCEYIGLGMYKPSGSSANEGQTIINKIASGEIKPLICLNENSTKGYENYGVSPSIDFPSPIQSVTGENEVGVNNKNILPPLEGKLYSSRNGVTTALAKDGKVILNGTPSSSWIHLTNGEIDITDLLEDGETYTLIQTAYDGICYQQIKKSDNKYIVSQNSKTSFTVNKSTITKYTYIIQIGDISKLSDAYNNYEVGFMLVKGEVDSSDYIEHQSQNYPISLGENEIFEDGYLNIEYEQNAGYKRVTRASIVNSYSKHIMDGTTNKFTYTHPGIFTETNKFFQFQIKGKKKTAMNDEKCNYLKVVRGSADNAIKENCLWHEDNTTIMYMSIPFLTTAEANTWLQELNTAGTPLEIVYPLATPTETELTDATLLSQLEALINAETYKNITHINTTNEGLKPSLEVVYKKDLETMFNNLNTAVIAIGGV